MFKKSLFLLLLTLAQFSHAAPTDDFVIRVKTDNPGGTSTNLQFTVPTLASLTYNYDVDCNNDTINEVVGATGDYTCNYTTAGTKHIRIKTTGGVGFPRIYFNGGGDKNKIEAIQQWGTNPWVSMNSAFEGAINLTTTPFSAPDLSNASSLAEMFKNATSVDPRTSNWDTSTITSFTGMFQGATSADPDTYDWDTSMATRFKYMFDGASSANPDTRKWDSSSVIEMEYMFRNAVMSNPDLRNWNIENVASIQGMFENVTLSTTIYDILLITFDAQNVNQNLDFDGGNSKYCAVSAHDNLTDNNNDNWAILDLGLDNNCPDPLDDFVITVKTDHPGTSDDTEFKIPVISFGNYDYSVDCNNDGINEAVGKTSGYTCEYPSVGTYTVRIKYNQVTNSGFPQIQFRGSGDSEKLLTIEQWGTNPWINMYRAFEGAINLTTTAADNPNFSNLVSLNNMFKEATIVTPNTSNWNVSTVTSMESMFEGAINANPDTSQWNVSLVNNMEDMFEGATNANPDVSLWDVSLVENFNRMFKDAESATPNTSTWVTSSATNMSSMFNGALLANPDTTLWDVSNVTSMSRMFFKAQAANPDTSMWITTSVESMTYMFGDTLLANPDVSQWDVSNVTTMNAMFYKTQAADPDTSTWITSSVESMSQMFRNSEVANPSVGQWDVSSVTHMVTMFDGAQAANPDTSIWILSSIESISLMFSNTLIANPDVSQWDISTIESLNSVFKNAQAAVPDVSQWNTSSVTSMRGTFAGALVANPDVSQWNTVLVDDMHQMFMGSTLADPDVSQWDTSSLVVVREMFADAVVANPDVSQWDTSLIVSMYKMFSGAGLANPDVSKWDTSSLEFMSQMFSSAPLANPDVSQWDVSNLTSLLGAFLGSGLTITNYDKLLKGWNQQTLLPDLSIQAGSLKYCEVAAHANMVSTSGHDWNVSDGGQASTDVCSAFVIKVDTALAGTPALFFDIPTKSGLTYNYNVDCDDDGTDELTNVMGSVLCSYTAAGEYFIRIKDNSGVATGFPAIDFETGADKHKILSVENWGSGIWATMDSAFKGATNLQIDATDAPDLSSVTDFSEMFAGATSMNGDIGHWDVQLIEDFSQMFSGASSFNQDIGTWQTGEASTFLEMFKDAIVFDQDIGDWDLDNVLNASGMFSGVTLSVVNYDALLIGWNNESLQTNLTFDAGFSKYCAISAHDNLTSNLGHNWTILDSGSDDPCSPNDDPTLTGLPTDFIVTEDIASILNFSMTTLSDADAGSSDVTLVIQTHNANVATLSAASSAQITITNTPTNSITLQGSVSEINDYLNNPSAIKFTGALNNNGNNADFITLTANDGGNTGIGGGTDVQVGSVSVDITAINDDPTVSGVPTDLTALEDEFTDLNLSTVSFADVDIDTGVFTVRISVDNGFLRHDIDGDGNYGAGLSEFDLTNLSISAMNTLIQTPSVFQYKGGTNGNGNNVASLTLFANDNGNTGDGGGIEINLGSINIDITAVNDDPTATGIPVDIIVVGGIASNLDLSTVVIDDVDAGVSDDIEVRIASSDQTSDNLFAQSSNNISVQSNGNNVVLFGTISEINNYLSIPSNMSYTADVSQVGDNIDTIFILVNDFGNTGIGGGNDIEVGSINIDVSYTEIIFKDDFELDLLVFKIAQASFEYDFSKVENLNLNNKPLLIAKGLNQTDEVVMKVYLRKIDNQLQIQMWNINNDGQWISNEWQNIDSKKLTAIYW